VTLATTTPKADALFRKLDDYIDSLGLNDQCVQERRKHLLPTLYRAQELFGFLPKEVQEFVAERLDLHLSEVYGVVSFYSFFTMKPQGKFRISVCTGTACHIRGADRVVSELSRQLGIDPNDVTRDHQFSLDTLRCVGACGLAPVVMVNDRVYGHVTADMVPTILRNCEQMENDSLPEAEHEETE